MLKPVVTQLRANITSASETAQPDVDLHDLRTAIDDLPELNVTRVVALHRRIINGDYKIDSERFASKLIELESSLDSQYSG